MRECTGRAEASLSPVDRLTPFSNGSRVSKEARLGHSGRHAGRLNDVFRLGTIIGSSSVEESECEESQSSLQGIEDTFFYCGGLPSHFDLSFCSGPPIGVNDETQSSAPSRTDSGMEFRLVRLWCFRGDLLLLLKLTLCSVVSGLGAIFRS